MATIADYFEQAELSLAAYALDLQQGMSNSDYTAALVAAGMTDAQAARFADPAQGYTIVDQYSDPLTGFSATIFDEGGTQLGTDHGFWYDHAKKN